MTRPLLVWLRDDLRLDDQPALRAAAGRPALFVYLHDEASPGLRPLGGAAKWWLAGSLEALDAALRARGGRLDIVAGAAGEAIPALARACAASEVVWTRRYGGAEIDIDAAIKVLNDDLFDQVRTRTDLVRVRDQFGQLVRKYGPNGKPKPPVEIVDEHDWNELWKNATVF